MMDGEAMFPEGWNAVRGYLTPRGEKHSTIYTRTQRPPRYYFIDFGLSRCFDPSDSNPLAEPIVGGDKTVPEFLTDREAFNPFHTDIYYLGNMIQEFVIQVCSSCSLMGCWLIMDRGQSSSIKDIMGLTS